MGLLVNADQASQWNSEPPMRIGIDLGGSKIAAIALDQGGAERLRFRVQTPAGDYAATIRAVTGLVAEAEARLGRPGTVGIGIPGVMSPSTGLVKNANSTWLIGMPLDRDLEAALGRPVRIANDANCFALSEATDGAAQGATSVFGVILGTGVGGGIVCHGEVMPGANAIAGEWGHNPLPWPDADERPGPACYCGKRGCIESFLSGPGLAADHAVHDPRGEESGDHLKPAEIAARAEAGDRHAEASLGRYERRLAKALATILNVVDPNVVVVGGGLSKLSRLYNHVPKLWGAYAFSDAIVTRFVPAHFGDDSGVRGAAWLWPAPARS
jgi:fructokinase